MTSGIKPPLALGTCPSVFLLRGVEIYNIKKFPSPGLPFGFTDDIPAAAAYQAQTIPLAPGDAILMFSDGAFEIHNVDDVILVLDGFIDILKELNYPREPLNMAALEEALLKVSNDIRLQDDITILEARFLSSFWVRLARLEFLDSDYWIRIGCDNDW